MLEIKNDIKDVGGTSDFLTFLLILSFCRRYFLKRKGIFYMLFHLSCLRAEMHHGMNGLGWLDGWKSLWAPPLWAPLCGANNSSYQGFVSFPHNLKCHLVVQSTNLALLLRMLIIFEKSVCVQNSDWVSAFIRVARCHIWAAHTQCPHAIILSYCACRRLKIARFFFFQFSSSNENIPLSNTIFKNSDF